MKKFLSFVGMSLFLASLLPAQAEVFDFCMCPSGTQKRGGLSTNRFYLQPQACCKNIQCCSSRLGAPVYNWAGAATWVKWTTPFNAWVSDGRFIDSYYLSNYSCKYPCKYCPTKPFDWYGQYRTFVTGMAANTRVPYLYVSDSLNNIYCCKIYRCNQIRPIAKCNLKLPKSQMITGLAYSCNPTPPHPYGVLFVAVATWYPYRPGSTVIFEIPLNKYHCPDPCKPICEIKVPYCKKGQLLGPATGLTFDSCKMTLYVSDLKYTAALQWAPHCKYKVICCCPNACGSIRTYYYGLGLKKCWCGASCSTRCQESYCFLSKNCKKCPTAIACKGTPSLGNSFSITLSNGFAIVPGFNWAILWMKPGPCRCYPIHYYNCRIFWCGLSGEAIKVVPYIGRLSGCVFNASATFNIPCDPVLCCGTACFQWTVVNWNSKPYTYCLSFSKCLQVKVGCP